MARPGAFDKDLQIKAWFDKDINPAEGLYDVDLITIVTGSVQFLTLTAAVTFVGAITNFASKIASAGLTPDGTPNKATSTTKTATLTFTGTITTLRQFFLTLAGSLATSGALLKSALLAQAASMGTDGAMTRQAQKTVSGSATTSSTLTRAMTAIRTGVLTFSGDPRKLGMRTFAGAVTFAGVVSFLRIFALVLNGAVTFAGATSFFIVITVKRTLSGLVSFIGELPRAVYKTRSATLPLLGAPHKRMSTLRRATLWLRNTLNVAPFKRTNFQVIRLAAEHSPYVYLTAKLPTHPYTGYLYMPAQQDFRLIRGTNRILRFQLPSGAVSGWTTQFTARDHKGKIVLQKAGTVSTVDHAFEVVVTKAESLKFKLDSVSVENYTFSFNRTDAGYEDALTTGHIDIEATAQDQ